MFHSLIPGICYLVEYNYGGEEVIHRGTFVKYVDAHCAEFMDVTCLYDSISGTSGHFESFFFYNNVPRTFTATRYA